MATETSLGTDGQRQSHGDLYAEMQATFTISSPISEVCSQTCRAR